MSSTTYEMEKAKQILLRLLDRGSLEPKEQRKLETIIIKLEALQITLD